MTTYERLISELGDGLGIALSPDSETIYVKTMFDSVQAYATAASGVEKRWEVQPGFGYESAPTP